VELDRSLGGFEASDLEEVRLMLIDQRSDIRRAWNRFSEQARIARARWVPILGLSEAGPVA